ncbi:MAG: DUF4249 domain-containing protein [Lentimicrobiaceae bacterium]|nr:DUF4249 domain-containing protein [Lentimicrobiaceae bacterium]
MNKLFLFSLILISVFFTSCISYIDEDKSFRSKLVLHCRLVPQLDTTILHLSHTVPIFTKNPQEIGDISNGMVEISNDNKQWLRMLYSPELKYYFIPQAQFPIIEGQTYYIRASVPNYEEVTSSCKVPVFRETHLKYLLKEVEGDTHDNEEYNFLHTHHYFEWTDFPEEENYYAFFEKYLWEELINENGDTIRPFYNWTQQHDMDTQLALFSDKGNDGKKMSLLFTISYSGEWSKQWGYEISMIQMDKHCYLFESSKDSSGSMNDFMSFFLLEPYQVYSNINNGYGLFGAFVMRDYALVPEIGQ